MELLLLHGWATNSKSHWFPYIKRELTKYKIKTRAPNLPHAKLPLLSEWSLILIKHLLEMKSPKIVVGHSLGGLTILRTLEKLNLKVDLAIFIATPIKLHANRKFLKNFYRKKYHWLKIKNNIGKAIVIHAKDDHLVPVSNARIIAKKLNAKLVITPKGGHFMIKQFPLLREIIVRELNHSPSLKS